MRGERSGFGGGYDTTTLTEIQNFSPDYIPYSIRSGGIWGKGENSRDFEFGLCGDGERTLWFCKYNIVLVEPYKVLFVPGPGARFR